MSMFFGLIRFLLRLTSSPAFENSRSEGTEVAGMLRYFLANPVSMLKFVEFGFSVI